MTDENEAARQEAAELIYMRTVEFQEKIKQDALDAARYRWLESKHNSGDEDWFVYGASSDNMTVSIDAAIAAEKKETQG